MTPTAVTPAARARRPTATRAPAPAASAADTAAPAPSRARPRTTAQPRPRSPHPSTPRGGHRAPIARSSAPRTNRRVSGPARPAPTAPAAAPAAPAPAASAAPANAAAASAAAGRRATRRPAAAPRPRRVSGPARTRAAAPPSRPLRARSLDYVRALPDHSLLDRVVRGRIWIPLLGVLLVGIVAMQVEVLKLNAGIGRSTVQTAQLQTANQQLRSTVAKLSGEQTIETEAAKLGYEMAAPTAVRFVSDGSSRSAARAAASVHAPDAASFSASLQQRSEAAAAAAGAASASQADSTDG
jgi:hypothetical protein